MYEGKLARLRAYRKEDIPIAQKYFNDAEMMMNMAMRIPFPYTLEDEEKWYAGMSAMKDKYDFAVEAIDTGEYIGGCGINELDWKNSFAVVGIAIVNKVYLGRGYGTEAVGMLVDFIFNEMNLNKVCLNVFAFNERAIKCYEKCGFVTEGVLRQQVFKAGRYWDERPHGTPSRRLARAQGGVMPQQDNDDKESAMIISSIDMKDGKVVQLRQGKDLVLERDNPEELIAEFDRYGEVAIIDLDQALRNVKADGTTANTAILKRLLRKGNVRVGGGIRDAKKAKELLSLGAEKVIIGSAAFALPDGKPGVNTAFLSQMAETIGRDHIIVVRGCPRRQDHGKGLDRRCRYRSDRGRESRRAVLLRAFVYLRRARRHDDRYRHGSW